MRQAEPVPFADVADGIAALRTGDIAVSIHAAPTMWSIGTDPREKQRPGIFQPLTAVRAARVVRAEDETPLVGIDLVLRQWRDSGVRSRSVGFFTTSQSAGCTVVKPRDSQACMPPRYHLRRCAG
jgi:hypothetical protein